jgi:hypothetical protein
VQDLCCATLNRPEQYPAITIRIKTYRGCASLYYAIAKRNQHITNLDITKAKQIIAVPYRYRDNAKRDITIARHNRTKPMPRVIKHACTIPMRDCARHCYTDAGLDQTALYQCCMQHDMTALYHSSIPQNVAVRNCTIARPYLASWHNTIALRHITPLYQTIATHYAAPLDLAALYLRWTRRCFTQPLLFLTLHYHCNTETARSCIVLYLTIALQELRYKIYRPYQ